MDHARDRRLTSTEGASLTRHERHPRLLIVLGYIVDRVSRLWKDERVSPIRRVNPTVPPAGFVQKSIYTPAYRRLRRRRIAGWALVVVGAVMAIAHMVTHLGRLHLLGYQDLLVGYPMASLLVFAGFLLVGFAAKA